MNIANRIESGHGDMLFKMSIAKQESVKVSHSARIVGDGQVILKYHFKDKSLLAFKMLDNNVTMSAQNG